MPVIAIDGPSGSGKSTLARALAHRLGIERLDTGAMYRAVTLLALEGNANLDDGAVLGALARGMDLSVDEFVHIGGVDVTHAIRAEEVTRAVSKVSAHPEVRAELVARQRAWVAARGGGVIEGRDIGSIVFPDADVKVYLTANAKERGRRRTAELSANSPGAESSLDELVVTEEMRRRDTYDSTRSLSPLVVTDDAIVIDSTDRGVEELVDQVLSVLS